MIDNIICFFLVLTNTGMGDINGINMHLLVRHNSTGEVLIDENRLIENISPQGRDTLQFKTLFVPQSLGDYNFTLTYQYPNENTSRTNSKTVTIRAGLGDPTTTTTYRIGTGGAFPTIESAMNALYHRGIAGHVVFELTAERNPRRGDSLIIDAGKTKQVGFCLDTVSLLDFRSKIMGVGPNATITFRPASELTTEQTPLTLNIHNPSGFGLAFGSAMNSNIDSAAVNGLIDTTGKSYFSESNGYITFCYKKHVDCSTTRMAEKTPCSTRKSGN